MLAGKKDLEPAAERIRRDQDEERAKGIGFFLFQDLLDEMILEDRMERS
jgi:hypothetical protein